MNIKDYFKAECELPCKCEVCLDRAREKGEISPLRMLFHACPKCGNKRCPKNLWHEYKCSGSNKLNQIPEKE